jgi:hypothetical protein
MATFWIALPKQQEIIVADRRCGGEAKIRYRDLRIKSPIDFIAILTSELRAKLASLTVANRLTPCG